jgi:hypothetical protein
MFLGEKVEKIKLRPLMLYIQFPTHTTIILSDLRRLEEHDPPREMFLGEKSKKSNQNGDAEST